MSKVLWRVNHRGSVHTALSSVPTIPMAKATLRLRRGRCIRKNTTAAIVTNMATITWLITVSPSSSAGSHSRRRSSRATMAAERKKNDSASAMPNENSPAALEYRFPPRIEYPVKNRNGNVKAAKIGGAGHGALRARARQ
jgi:hypothetical protein